MKKPEIEVNMSNILKIKTLNSLFTNTTVMSYTTQVNLSNETKT